MSKRPKQTEFHVAVYAGENLPPVSKIEATFSWLVVRADSRDEAIRCAIADDDGIPRSVWKWALFRWPANRVTGARPRIDALRLIHNGEDRNLCSASCLPPVAGGWRR